MSEQDTIPAGTVVGGCKIIECIGTGGMGQVYKAQHQRLGRMIALKILPEDVIRRHPAGIERFFQEARTLANVEHPNVLTIHDCGEDGKCHYLQTRFIEGKNLEELVADSPNGLSWQQVRDILIGALLGLGAVHRAGMVHRDVKPGNFMLDQGQRVILMDFGLAKFLSASNDARTEPGYVLGTPQYMSPEQCDGLELDPRSDIYSLGCVAYFLLVGKRPFDSDNPLAIMKMHRDTYAPPLMQVRPSAGPEICHIVERMMQKNPDDRYSDTDAVVRDLRTLGTDAEHPVVSAPPRGSIGLPPSAAPDSNMPAYPPTRSQPAGMPPTAGPMASYPPTSAQPRGIVQPAGGFARAAGAAQGPLMPPAPPSMPGAPGLGASPGYNQAANPAYVPGPATMQAQSLEAQSMESLYRNNGAMPPANDLPYDSMGPTIAGPSPLGPQVRKLTPPAGLPMQPPPPLAAPISPLAQAPLVAANPVAPLRPPVAAPVVNTPAAHAEPPVLSTPTAPPAGAQSISASGLPRSGPTTVEVQAGVQKLRRNTARIEPGKHGADASAHALGTAASAPAPASAAAPVEAAAVAGVDVPMDGASRNSQILQAIQCKHCHHLWRIDRGRLGKMVRCPNCSKDTMAQLPDNLIAPVNRARLLLKLLIVIVLLGGFSTVVYYLYREFKAEDTSPMTIQAKMNDLTDLFKQGDFGQVYDKKFSANMKKVYSRSEWTRRWQLKMNDREVTQATLDFGQQYTAPITAKLTLVMRRVTGDHAEETYHMDLKLIQDDRNWIIDDMKIN